MGDGRLGWIVFNSICIIWPKFIILFRSAEGDTATENLSCGRKSNKWSNKWPKMCTLQTEFSWLRMLWLNVRGKKLNVTNGSTIHKQKNPIHNFKTIDFDAYVTRMSKVHAEALIRTGSTTCRAESELGNFWCFVKCFSNSSFAFQRVSKNVCKSSLTCWYSNFCPWIQIGFRDDRRANKVFIDGISVSCFRVYPIAVVGISPE